MANTFVCVIKETIGLHFRDDIIKAPNSGIFQESKRNTSSEKINSTSVMEDSIQTTKLRILSTDSINSEFQRLKNWSELCIIRREQNSNNTFDIICSVVSNSTLKFIDFRLFTSKLPSVVLIDLYITCIGGHIRFPWPFRAHKLNRLQIINCNIKDFRTEFKAKKLKRIPDTIKFLHMENITVILKIKELFDSISRANAPIIRPALCGPENAKIIIRRNTAIEFEDFQNAKNYDANSFIDRDVLEIQQIKCSYKHLEILEISGFKDMEFKTVKKIMNTDEAPNLRILNFSRCSVRYQSFFNFENFRSRFPLLEFFDLSHNDIAIVPKIHDRCLTSRTTENQSVVLDLRFNKISTLKKYSIDSFSRHKFLKVDISDNPFKCECETFDIVKYIQFKNLSVVYDYLKTLKCNQPESFKGRTFFSLRTNEFNCETEIFTYTLFLVLCVTTLIIFTCTLLLIYFSHNIKVLLYTRLNINLCCLGDKTGNKIRDYDAFVAYSEDDADWVFNTALPKLETLCLNKPIKLCLHHRDFVIGASIADNIFESIQNSRNTMLIVSSNFLKSEWCLMEFRTALQKNLKDKNHHLIVVILGDVDFENIDSDLKQFISVYTHLTVGETFFWDKLRYAFHWTE